MKVLHLNFDEFFNACKGWQDMSIIPESKPPEILKGLLDASQDCKIRFYSNTWKRREMKKWMFQVYDYYFYRNQPDLILIENSNHDGAAIATTRAREFARKTVKYPFFGKVEKSVLVTQ